MKCKIGSVFCLVLFLGLISLCTAPGLWAGEPTIKIGLIGPFTGPTAFNGGEMKKGQMLAVDALNEQGGLFGRKIEIVLGDTESKPAQGVAAVKKLITRNDVLIIGGGYHSSVNIATSEVCQREKVPNVVGIAISPTITSRGFDFVFRTAPTSIQILSGINDWVKVDKKPKVVGFLMENSDYGRDAEKIWLNLAKEVGAKVGARLYFEIGDTDFTAQISKLKNLRTDIVFNVGSTTETAIVQKQAKELDFVTQWIGTGGQMTQAFFEMTGTTCAYNMASTLEPTILAKKDPIVADFVKRYKEKWDGARPGLFSSQGYDNMMVILDAVKRAGAPTGNLEKDRLRIKEALGQTKIRLTQGFLQFDKTGQVDVKPTPVQIQIVDGKPKLEVVYPPDRATGTYQEPLPWAKRPW